jgi:hypothetical protein
LFVCCAGVLTGCQVNPNSGDTTNATLRFRIHYNEPGIASPNVEVTATKSIEANQCVYVASTFGVAANAADSGGIRSITLGPSSYLNAVQVRTQNGDIVALPSPSVPTQPYNGGTIPNPGNPPGTAMVSVSYAQGKTFDTVTLSGAYQFAGGATLAALRGTVRNFGSSTGVSEVYNFYVRPATAHPAQQPGMACPMP